MDLCIRISAEQRNLSAGRGLQPNAIKLSPQKKSWETNTHDVIPQNPPHKGTGTGLMALGLQPRPAQKAFFLTLRIK
ncbi:hypothetical protein PN36_13245 [Candidatus Thiomargarita nelsonii]|uniref:Uncharacterized protein n=1 Tax=Candidatus Thiomargarita nelsonii TaxID=1003181 RepID=A0A0A6PHP1_9GAMM|nr:hypothetical protein PN36_13245 [Candidatus Thiomargarita nelsonii]